MAFDMHELGLTCEFIGVSQMVCTVNGMLNVAFISPEDRTKYVSSAEDVERIESIIP